MRPYILTLSVCIAFTLTRCGDEDVIQGLQVELVSTNEELNELYEFSEGEDIWFLLKVTNLTDQELELSNHNSCLIMNDKSFLVIYKNEKWKQRIGRALPEDDIVCALLNIQTVIPPNESIYLAGGNWFSNPNNTALNPGSYFSDYTLNINGTGYYVFVKFKVKAN